MFSINKFAERILSLRKSKGLNQQQLADAIGVTKSTISRIESSTRAASIEVLYALSDYFNVSLDYLVGRSDDNNIIQGSTDLLSKDEELILKNFRLLDDLSKGKLIERSRMLLEESTAEILHNQKKNA